MAEGRKDEYPTLMEKAEGRRYKAENGRIGPFIPDSRYVSGIIGFIVTYY